MLLSLSTMLLLAGGCGGGGMAATAPTSGSTPTPGTVPATALTLQRIASGFSAPLGLESPDDSGGRLFVVEQGGTIRIIQNGAAVATPFLDISSKVTSGGEMGLLGLTFHSGFPTNPRFYVNYVRTVAGQIQSVIAEYQLSTTNANQADVASERILLTVNQVGNFSNHKAGQLAFGSDGFLYFGLGDGGGGGDPNGNGQNKNTLLGKMMRIDVDATSPGLQYRIPPDNPFAAGGGLPEIWAYGFRNPWRFSFDRSTGRQFVADVGQDAFEEIDIVTKGGNYGWNTMEGLHCFNPSSGCNMAGLALPISEYSHSEGVAVIGGFVYHGSALPFLQGLYVFGDLNTGKIFTLKQNADLTWTRTLLTTTALTISSFGQDQSGELYLIDFTGNVFKMVPM
jgi:glucose/arabinose dehydrogenase